MKRISPAGAFAVHNYFHVCPESPDGRRVAYSLYPDGPCPGNAGPCDVMVCDREGTRHRKVGAAGAAVHHVGARPTWIDDDRLAYQDVATHTLHIVNVDTLQEVVYEGGVDNYSPVLGRMYYCEGRPDRKSVRYLDLATFFIDERGTQPHYYDIEARERGDDPAAWRLGRYDYNQSHLPVRQQETAEGHAVRAMYLYSGMADVAAETGDETLVAACRRLWENVTTRRMYVTGGIGSSATGERFTYDYDLPNDLAYTETCAAIGLVFWAHRMVQLEADARYADIMERALYNGALSGISLDGKRFFYANPLEVDPVAMERRTDLYRGAVVTPTRQEWFGCACCPPNIARLLASLGAYAYSVDEAARAAYVHLYAGGRASLSLGGGTVELEQATRYPWEGEVRLAVRAAGQAPFALALRIPGWCRNASLAVNGEPLETASLLRRGYAWIERAWRSGDVVTLNLPMPVERIEAHPAVHEDAGRAALQRGPVVYCLEEVDNGPHLRDVVLPRDTPLDVTYDPDLLGGVVVIRGQGWRRDPAAWGGDLYRPAGSLTKAMTVTAIPYYAWANRALGEMLVWLREA